MLQGNPRLTLHERSRLTKKWLEEQYNQVLPKLSYEEERKSRKLHMALSLRIFAYKNFDEGTSGHITARDPEYPDCLWVNSYGVYWGHVTVDDLILVNKEAKIIAGKGQLNPAAFAIHASIHEARPDAVASCHTHSEYGRAWSTLGRLLDPICQDACSFYEDHSVYSTYGGVASEVDEGQAITKVLGKSKACILQNHGLLTVGQSVDEAVWWFISMERCCKVQILAESGGKKPTLIPHDIAQLTAAQMGAGYIGWYQFQPLYQMALRKWPDVAGANNTALGITSPSVAELAQFGVRSKL